MARMRLNSDGELETLKPDDWLALRERMRAVRRAGAGQETPYLRILLCFVQESDIASLVHMLNWQPVETRRGRRWMASLRAPCLPHER